MKKQLKLILLICLVSTVSFAQKTVYVDTDGSDSNNGSITSPYKTFAKAVSVMTAGDTCIIREGVYEQQLIVSKNGNANNYLTFKAAEGENVQIRATSKINGWESHSGNIYKATVNMSIPSRFRTIYHNENYMDLARWPNNSDNDRWTVDCAPVTGGDGTHFQVAGGIPNIDWSDGGIVYYLGSHSGTSWIRPVTSNTTTRISYPEVDIENDWPFTNHNPTRIEGSPDNRRGQLFLFNKLEALDHDREWYYDESTNTLYFQAEGGTKPENGSVEYANYQYAIRLQGDYIKLEGINVFGGSIFIENRADYNQILNCTVVHGVEGHDDIENRGAQVGEGSMQVLGDFTLIKGCTINHSSVSGINIAGWAADDCTIEGNTISNIDYVGIHASPIRTSGDRTKILKNTIFNAGRDGMYVSGVNCEIAYNDVSYSQKINSDSGIFYTVGNNSDKNTEIHHNWFHNATAPSYSHNPDKPAKAAGIYLDNNSKGYLVHHNVVWNVSWTGYQVNWNNERLNFYHNSVWNSWGAMDSWVNGREQSDNKIYNNYASSGDWHMGNGSSEFDIRNSPIFLESPFVDAENRNFMPRLDSELVDKAPLISGFTKKYKGSLPDIGAYEVGGTRWTAGVDAIEDTGDENPTFIYDAKFTIVSTSETCIGQNNGQIKITADIGDNYILKFNGEDINFTKENTIENLAPGNYELCIASYGNETESQCYNIAIKEAGQLSAKTTLQQKSISLQINEGSAPFNVSVNDKEVLTTMSNLITVPVSQGDVVKVKSDKECEGEILKKIDFYANITAYPNPTNGKFQLSVPINIGEVAVDVYNIQGQLIHTKQYSTETGKIDLSLENKPSGIYFAKIAGDNKRYLKIIKK